MTFASRAQRNIKKIARTNKISCNRVLFRASTLATKVGLSQDPDSACLVSEAPGADIVYKHILFIHMYLYILNDAAQGFSTRNGTHSNAPTAPLLRNEVRVAWWNESEARERPRIRRSTSAPSCKQSDSHQCCVTQVCFGFVFPRHVCVGS